MKCDEILHVLRIIILVSTEHLELKLFVENKFNFSFHLIMFFIG